LTGCDAGGLAREASMVSLLVSLDILDELLD